jgi:hypothetical protein
MQNKIHTPIFRYLVSLLLSIAFLLNLSCESNLTDSLEGRPCAANYKCLPGYVCDKDTNLCIKETKTEEEAVKSKDATVIDAENRNVTGSAIDLLVDANTKELDSTTDNSDQDAQRFDTALADIDLNDIDATIDSRVEIDSSTTTGQSDVEDAAPTESAAGDFDAADNPMVCGQGIEPTRTNCPTICQSCENGVCYIVCDDEKPCDKEEITCPPEFDCGVQCSHIQACEKATIDCPHLHSCVVSCTGELSCEKAEINCFDGPCELRCGPSAHACQKADLKCGVQKCEAVCEPGQDPPNVKDCELSCSEKCDC